MCNLLYHNSQLELDEAVVFGLGSGIDCLLSDTPWASPPLALFRNLQAGFMHWARQQRPELVSDNCVQLAQQSARQWTAVSDSMETLVVRSDDIALRQTASQQVLAAHEKETSLYDQIAEKLVWISSRSTTAPTGQAG